MRKERDVQRNSEKERKQDGEKRGKKSERIRET